MKKYFFIILFIFIQLFFIFFYIYKESKLIKLSYQKQKYEKTIGELENQKQNLKQQILINKDNYKIKDFATKKLNMKNIRLDQIINLNKT